MFKKLLILILVLMTCVYGLVASQPISPPLNIRSTDETVTNYPYSLHVTPTSALIDNGDGTMQITVAGTTGGSGDITDVFNCASGDCNNVVMAAGDVLNASLGILRLPTSATPPACTIGDIYFDTAAPSGQHIYACESMNSWETQGDGGGALTPWTSNISGAGYSLSGVGSITSTARFTAPYGSILSMSSSSYTGTWQGDSILDAYIDNAITLDNITQVTNRSHTNLSDIGTFSHSYLDSHASSTSMHATSTGSGSPAGGNTNSIQYHASGTTFGGSDSLMFYSATNTLMLSNGGHISAETVSNFLTFDSYSYFSYILEAASIRLGYSTGLGGELMFSNSDGATASSILFEEAGSAETFLVMGRDANYNTYFKVSQSGYGDYPLFSINSLYSPILHVTGTAFMTNVSTTSLTVGGVSFDPYHASSSGMHATGTGSGSPAGGNTNSIQYHASGTTFGGSDNLMFYGASSTPQLHTSGTAYFRNSSATTTPLNIEGRGFTMTQPDGAMTNDYYVYGAYLATNQFASRGTQSAPSQTLAGDILGLWQFTGCDDLNCFTAPSASLEVKATENFDGISVYYGTSVKLYGARQSYSSNDYGMFIDGLQSIKFGDTNLGDSMVIDVVNDSVTTTARFTAQSGSILNMTSSSMTTTALYATGHITSSPMGANQVPVHTSSSYSGSENLKFYSASSTLKVLNGKVAINFAGAPVSDFQMSTGTPTTAPNAADSMTVIRRVTSTALRTGIFVAERYNTTASDGNIMAGINGYAYDYGDQNVTNAIGLVGGRYLAAKMGSGGTISGARAIDAQVYFNNTITGTISDAYNVYSTGVDAEDGTVTRAWNFYADAHVKDTGTLTRAIGLGLEDQTAGSGSNIDILIGTLPVGNYGIYNASAYQNYFLGNLGLATTTPGSLLSVAGNAQITGAVKAGGGSAGKATCWKADGLTLGYCSSAVAADGSCTCN